MVPLLSNVMINVVPYLKNHSRSNLAFYRACSRLLASLSEYQNTRKAWKKEAMELLIDPVFFQIDLTSLRHWKTTVDNLMTHDKTTFKDLMSKFIYFITFLYIISNNLKRLKFKFENGASKSLVAKCCNRQFPRFCCSH